MPGGSVALCMLAPFAVLGLMFMASLRLELVQGCVGALAKSRRAPGRRLEGSSVRLAGLAAANILIPLLASFFGMAALASHMGGTPLVSGVLHGLNVAQGLLGLWLMAKLLWPFIQAKS